MSKNDVTGDDLKSKVVNDLYRDGLDRIFREKSSETTTIVYWPHGTWCDLEDVGDYTHLSDDFAYLDVPLTLTDDEVDHLVRMANGA